MSQVSFADVRAGVDNAVSTATRHATDLAKDEHHQNHQHLVAAYKKSDCSHAAAEMVYKSKETDLHDQAVVVESLAHDKERAHAAAQASSRDHNIQIADLNNQPRPRPPPDVPSPPRSTSPTAATRPGRHTQPDTWAAVASGTYHASSYPPFNDSYLNVRVSSFRHHNLKFPTATKEQVYNLSLAVYAALRPIP